MPRASSSNVTPRRNRNRNVTPHTPPTTLSRRALNTVRSILNTPAGQAGAGALATQTYNIVTRSAQRAMAPTTRSGGGGSGGGSAGSRNPRFTKKVTGAGRRRSKKKKSKRVAVTNKQVKKWNKAVKDSKSDLACFNNRYITTGNNNCAANVSSFVINYTVDMTTIQQMMASVPYYDEAGARTTRNPTDQTYAQTLRCTLTTNGTWYNNYAVPCWLSIYVAVPKEDNALSPMTAFTNGLTAEGTISATGTLTYPSHSKEYTKMYEHKTCKSVCLQPGESISASYEKKFNFDPSLFDSHTEAQQSRYGTHFYLSRIQGVTGHAVASVTPGPLNVGTSIARVDFKAVTNLKIIYDSGGGKTTDVNFSETGLLAQTGGTVVGWPTNAENTTYSTT